MMQAFVYLIGGILLYFIGKSGHSTAIPPPPIKNKEAEKLKDEVDSEDDDTVRNRARDKWMR